MASFLTIDGLEKFLEEFKNLNTQEYHYEPTEITSTFTITLTRQHYVLDVYVNGLRIPKYVEGMKSTIYYTVAVEESTITVTISPSVSAGSNVDIRVSYYL